jgi:hypothetical protein
VLAAWALVDGRVEFEADEILAGGEVDLERPIATDRDPLFETGGETEVDESGRTDVQPARSEAERLADVDDGLGEELGQRCRPWSSHLLPGTRRRRRRPWAGR